MYSSHGLEYDVSEPHESGCGRHHRGEKFEGFPPNFIKEVMTCMKEKKKSEKAARPPATTTRSPFPPIQRPHNPFVKNGKPTKAAEAATKALRAKGLTIGSSRLGAVQAMTGLSKRGRLSRSTEHEWARLREARLVPIPRSRLNQVFTKRVRKVWSRERMWRRVNGRLERQG